MFRSSAAFAGSPPPMRGKGKTVSIRNVNAGITPAYAGKSVEFLKTEWEQKGSPPPMRGKVDEVHEMKDNVRITPAYAGKRISMRAGRFPTWDHPRLCGEKAGKYISNSPASGSPPPMRGKVHTELHCGIFVRITPAYAGKSVSYEKLPSVNKDHPRLCGEKTKKILKQRYFFHQPASFSFSLQYT